MNYRKIYNDIIERRKYDIPNGYIERHHIIPRSLGGNDDSDNIVRLTAREHFICHYLLIKMQTPDTLEYYKMVNAFMLMKVQSTYQNRYINSRLYETLRKHHSKAMSLLLSGANNSAYNTHWIVNLETTEERRVSKHDTIPDGWVKGRSTSLFKKHKKKPCKCCGCDTCNRPEVCKKKQTIQTLIKHCGFGQSTVGTLGVYDEYDRIVRQLHKDYHEEMLSVEDITNKYNFNSNERVRCMLRNLGIARRNLSDAVKNTYKSR